MRLTEIMTEPLTIVCTTCSRPYEYAAEKLMQGGLRGQGWECLSGNRVCPNCLAERVESSDEGRRAAG